MLDENAIFLFACITENLALGESLFTHREPEITIGHPRRGFQCLVLLLIHVVAGIALILFIESTQALLKKKRLSKNLALPIFIANPVLFFFATFVCTTYSFGTQCCSA